MLNRLLLDPQAFAAKAESLRGSVLLSDLDQRVYTDDIADQNAELHYEISGGTDKWQRPFLDFSVSGSLKLYCQRCMQPTDFRLNEKARIVLFGEEEKLDEAMLADDELEGMLLEAELDVLALLEDQILMALPISPKHDDCNHPDLEWVNRNPDNPFAALAGLKKG